MQKNHTYLTLQQNREEILLAWESRAFQEISSTLGLSSLALQDKMQDFLITIEEALEKVDRSIPVEKILRELNQSGFSKEHGAVRVSVLNYSIDQVIYEYHIFREVLFEALEKDQTLIKTERNLLMSIIEQAVSSSATQFSDTLRSVREAFVAALTHDLKTPVTSAMIGAQYLHLHALDKSLCNKALCRKTSERIVCTMKRMEKMIEDLLDASRIEAGEGIDLKFEEFDLVLMVKELVTNCNMIYGKRFVLKTPKVVRGKWSFNGLQRILENLTNNASKYSYPNTSIFISLIPDLDNIKIVIKNEGVPISLEQQKVIFQQFRRLRTATDQKGWGLGLMLSQGIAQAHGGEITLESSLEKGIIFTVTLPRWVTINPALVLPQLNQTGKTDTSRQIHH